MEISGAIFASVTTVRATRLSAGRCADGCSCSNCGDKKAAGGTAASDAASTGAAATTAAGKPLSDDEQKQVTALKRRDDEVRRHEAAHLASAGGNARGGPVFDYQTGPDGRRYAVGGHVDIDVSPVSGNPQATLAKMQQVQRAALAPADPSGQDRAVAAQAASAAAKARQELSRGTSPSSSSGQVQSGQPASSTAQPSAPTRSIGRPQGVNRFEPPAESGRRLDVLG